MVFALVVMPGLVLLIAVVNNRREPSRWDSQLPRRKGRRAPDGSAWVFGGDSGGDCGGDRGGCDGADGGGDYRTLRTICRSLDLRHLCVMKITFSHREGSC